MREEPPLNMWVLLFLKDFTVPFTNNQGERYIRMTKVNIAAYIAFFSRYRRPR